MSQNPQSNQQSGFTIIEILVGIIMATIFVLITSQAIAISAVFRVRAQREAEAVNWIQEDLENIKFASLGNLTATCDATTTTAGYGQTLINNVTANYPLTSSRTLLNKSYSMSRTLAVYNSAPFRLMTVSYSVSDPESGKVISTLYTEVIPDAALNCK